MEICTSMKRQCSQLAAIEGILLSRGVEMENSQSYDHHKLVEYLHRALPRMPPLGKPRAFIDSFSPKNPLPFEIRQKLNSLPPITTRSETKVMNWRTKNKNEIQDSDLDVLETGQSLMSVSVDEDEGMF